MIYIGLLVFVAIIFGLALLVGAALIKLGSDRDERFNGWAIVVISTIVFLLFTVGLTIGSSFKQVGAGHVGLVYTFGDITGQREAGFNLIAPWQGFKVVSVQTQKIRPETVCRDKGTGIETPDCLEAFSQENQDVFVVATVNLHVSPDDVQALYIQYGADYIDKLLRPRLHQLFKEEVVKYPTEEVALNRQQIRVNVLRTLTAELAPFSIVVEDLLLDNVDFNQLFKDAIAQKQIASQEALKQQELVLASQFKADQAIEEARGQAEANTILAASLQVNGNFVLQFEAIKRLAPNIKIILIPNDGGIIPVLGADLLGAP